jgi:hypothetical protein
VHTHTCRGIALSGFNTAPPGNIQLGGAVALVADFESASGLFRPIPDIVGSEDHFIGFEQLILDDEAITKARMVDGYDIELWSGHRSL